MCIGYAVMYLLSPGAIFMVEIILKRHLMHLTLILFHWKYICTIEWLVKFRVKNYIKPHFQHTYTVSQEFPDSVKNMLLLKNLQFWPDHYEILSKWGPHEYLLLSKFRNDRAKIVDFLIIAYFWPSPDTDTPGTQCTSQKIRLSLRRKSVWLRKNYEAFHVH